jgi:hypothetical protein
MIKAALLHLALGALLGGLILGAKGLPQTMGWAWLLLSAHIQLLIGGWLIQLALGMAYWILPRLDHGERGRAAAAWISFVTLNAGVIGAALLLALRPWQNAAWLDALLALAGLLQIVALGAFVLHAWPRLRPIASPQISRAEAS